MPETTPQIAIIGDLHSAWTEADVRYFNGARYELLLFTGDLGSSLTRDSLVIARSLANLQRPALVMLGNNDVPHHAAISAELTYRRGVAGLLRSDELQAPLLRTCGFSAHRLAFAGLEATLIAGRPFAMGGDDLSFAAALDAAHGVSSAAQARERLRALVDGADTELLVFLAHNGPTGLGATQAHAWGRDFGGATGDWGDSDLTDAVAYARERGRKPLAVIAGHMHWSDARPRQWYVERDGTLYVNAARVPRVFAVNGQVRRMHFALSLSPERAHVAPVEVPAIDDTSRAG